MKVVIGCNARDYWLTEYTDWHEKFKVSFVEIPDEDWRDYQDHLNQCQEWIDFIVGLEAEQKAKS
jgi:hypothetical protein